VYQNVKHLMIPLQPIDPAQRAWIEAVGKLAVAYSTELHGDCEHSRQLDSFFLQTAAELVWNDTEGKPCWSRLDVDRFVNLHGDSAGWEGDWHAHAAVTMLAFYHWLVNNSHLDLTLAAPVLDKLDVYVSDWMCALGLGALCSSAPAAQPN
jgi:hypothetical protein